MRVRDLFSEDDLDAIQQAIAKAEEQTTGEIRVHLTARGKGMALPQARNLFGRLKMHKTTDRNGVLIYIDVASKEAAVWSDTALNDALDTSFWSTEIEGLTQRFAQGAFRQGVVAMVEDVGRVLHTYFPSSSPNENQLTNEVSIDDEEH